MINRQQIFQWWDIFKHGSELTEIRILDGQRTYSGYFTDITRLIEAVEHWDKALPSAQIYFTLNIINDACYGRAQRDKVIQIKREPTTGDADIVGRTHILIDLDPKRPAGVSSSNKELECAHLKAVKVYRYLLEQGFNEPIICKSGNGYHVVIPCQIAVNTETTETIKTFLQVMALLFDDDMVEVDQKVFNPSRICKLYGVVAKKGENTPERPWRQSEIIKVPKEIKPTDIAYFKKVANLMPKEEPRPAAWNNYQERFDLVEFLNKHGIGYKAERVAGGTKYILDHCPFNDQHKHKDAAIFQRDNGAIGFICLHNSCSDKSWKDVRLLFEPDAYDKDYSTPHRTFSPNPKSIKPQQQLPIVPQVDSEEKGHVWQTMCEIDDEDRSQIVSIPSGITQYDRECCGFDKPSLTIWSGNNGSAKSTLLNQIAINAVHSGFKVAIYSGELRGKKMKRWIILQAAGKQYNKKSNYNEYDYFTPNIIKDKIVEWLGDKLYNYNTKYSHDLSQVCAEIEALVKEKKIDMLIMDNLSSLDIENLESGINEQQKAAIKMLLRLTDKLEIATHLVVHPKKSEGYLRKNDVSGAKTLTDLADNVLFVHRWNQDTQNAAKEFMSPITFRDLCDSGTTNIVEVIKQREFGEAEGHIYKLYYEPESRRLKNEKAEAIHYGWEDEPTQAAMVFTEPVQQQTVPQQVIQPRNTIQVPDGMPFAPPSNDDVPF